MWRALWVLGLLQTLWGCGPDYYIRHVQQLQRAGHNSAAYTWDLCKLGDFPASRRAAEFLITQSRHQDASVRCCAVIALGQMAPVDHHLHQEMVEALIDRLADTECGKRTQMLFLPLPTGLTEKLGSTRAYALCALTRWARADLGFDQKAWRKRFDQIERERRPASKQGSPGCAPRGQGARRRNGDAGSFSGVAKCTG
jgi:hypothetical protein